MRLMILILLLVQSVSAVEISEIMYNPVGNDNNLEYVEVYSEEELNLSEYVFEDSSSSDELVMVQASDSRYYLIVEEGFNFSLVNASVYSAGATLGNNLNNEQDVAMLRDSSGKVITVVSYTAGMGGNGNGQALCVNGTLYECVPTPGAENPALISGINTTNMTNMTTNASSEMALVDYNGIKINEVLPNPKGLDSDEMPDGEWIELVNMGAGIELKGVEICDKEWTCIGVDGEHAPSLFIGSHGFLVVYANGKSILNNAGVEHVRLVHEGKILDEMVYEGSHESLSWSLVDEIWIVTEPTAGLPNIKSENVNKVEPAVNMSKLVIKKVHAGSDGIVKFGDTVDVRLWAYKGETNQQRVTIRVENMSTKVQVNLVEKYRSYELVLPLLIDQNCKGTLMDGVYRVVAEGLGLVTTEEMVVNGSTSSCFHEQSFTVLPRSGSGESIINSSSQQQLTGQVVYTSRQESIKRYGLYGFIVVVLLVFGYFLFQR